MASVIVYEYTLPNAATVYQATDLYLVEHHSSRSIYEIHYRIDVTPCSQINYNDEWIKHIPNEFESHLPKMAACLPDQFKNNLLINHLHVDYGKDWFRYLADIADKPVQIVVFEHEIDAIAFRLSTSNLPYFASHHLTVDWPGSPFTD
jgi:hypothetical protein